jgi:hypothetical protein
MQLGAYVMHFESPELAIPAGTKHETLCTVRKQLTQSGNPRKLTGSNPALASPPTSPKK